MKHNQHRPRGAAHSLVALQVAEQAAIATLELVSKLPPPLKVYKDQAIRASGSAALNLAEGSSRRGREQARFYQVAHGSAREALTAVRIVVLARFVDEDAGYRVMELLDRTAALTYGLWRGRT